MKQELFKLLLKDAFFRKKVVLSSGKTSNYYIDVRRVSISPAGIYYISHLVFEIIKDMPVTAIGGPTLGADPIVSGVCFLAHQNKKKLKGFIVRKTPKKHGRQRLLEGQSLTKRDSAVIVDDVATSGSSLINTIEVLQKLKVKVVAAVTVVDRQEGARENLSRFHCPLISLFKTRDFLTACREK